MTRQPDTHTASTPGHDAARRARIDEALDVLRNKDVRSTTLERLKRTRDADAHVRDRPQPLQLGEGFRHLLEHITVPVASHDLLLGRILEEVPDDEGEALLRQTAETWKGRSIPSWMRDGGHECFAWDRLLRLGLTGLETVAREELDASVSRGDSQDHLDFLQGAVCVYQAFQTYARRYASAARSAGLDESAASCDAIAERPPETFAEALQLLWLVGHVFCTMLSSNPTLTFGRMDELLLPYYRSDLRARRLTRDHAGDLIEDFYCKNNLILGRGEH